MPNWCSGNIRFRGKKKDIKRFLLNEIVCCRYDEGEIVEQKTVVYDDYFCITISKPPERGWYYIRGTHRNFFDCENIVIWMNEEADEDDEIIVCVDHFEVAWGFEKCDAWIEIAKKYCFDVKLTGYERGTFFSDVKTYFRDGSVEDDYHKYTGYEDWMWNCPHPNAGG